MEWKADKIKVRSSWSKAERVQERLMLRRTKSARVQKRCKSLCLSFDSSDSENNENNGYCTNEGQN